MRIPGLLKQHQQIAYMMGEGNYTRVYLINAPPQIYARSLRYFTEMLPEFVRIHKTYLVNLSYIKDYRSNEAGEVSLQVLDQWLPVSRRRLKEVILAFETVLTVTLVADKSAQRRKVTARPIPESTLAH